MQTLHPSASALRVLTKLGIGLVALFVLDRLAKYVADSALASSSRFLWDPYIGLSLRHNTGIAFSIHMSRWFIIAFSCFIILFFSMYMIRAWHRRNLSDVLGTGFIVIGALSNLIDRVRFGYVVDFIVVWPFSIFNLADFFIVCGVSILLLTYFYKQQHYARQTNDRSDYRH